MDTARRLALVTRLAGGLGDAGTADLLDGSVADDVILRRTIEPGTPLSGPFHGADGVKEYLSRWNATVDVRERVVTDVFGGDHKVVAVGRETLQAKATGEGHTDADWAMICTFHDDKIADILVIQDSAPIVDGYRNGAASAPDPDPSAAERLSDITDQMYFTKAIALVASYGIADLLADGCRSVEELASACGAQPSALYRLLRFLASIGIVAEEGDRGFRLGPLGHPLRSDVAGSMRDLFCMIDDIVFRLFADADYSIKTGEPAFEHVFGAPFFAYLAQHPEQEKRFSKGLTVHRARVIAAVPHAVDFDAMTTVVDVGGGQGALLAAILQIHPHLRGVLFDLPEVVSSADDVLAAAGVDTRCEIVGGDFFQSVPEGGDAYVLSWIIHDWPEEQALTILGNCRRVMEAPSRLLVIEAVVGPDEPDPNPLLDLLMLVSFGGRERTEAEYRDLLARAGFTLSRVLPTGSAMSVLEAHLT